MDRWIGERGKGKLRNLPFISTAVLKIVVEYKRIKVTIWNQQECLTRCEDHLLLSTKRDIMGRL